MCAKFKKKTQKFFRCIVSVFFSSVYYDDYYLFFSFREDCTFVYL